MVKIALKKSKIGYAVLATAVLILLCALFIRPAIIFVAKKQLHTVFKDSEVSIRSCRLDLFRSLSLFDISIKKKQAYDFLVKEVTAQYSIASLVKAEVPKLFFKDVTAAITLPHKNIAGFSGYLKSGSKSLIRVKTLELSNGKFDVKTKDLNVRGAASLQADLSTQIIERLDLTVDTLGMRGAEVSGFSLQAAQGSSQGRMNISRIKYNKLTLSDIKSPARFSGKELFLNGLSAAIFDGTASGVLKVMIDPVPGYSAELKFTGLDIARCIEDLELKEKFEMTGRISGDLAVAGKGVAIEVLNGTLTCLEPGGTLTIKDETFLKNMAAKTGQSAELLVESFKDYQYTIGTTQVSLDGGNIVLDTALDGKAGKRNLRTVLHNFTLRKE